MIEELRFTATGVGSLPYKTEKDALGLISEFPNLIPYWPQLPQRSKFESMIVQYSDGLDFLELDDNGDIRLSGDIDGALQRFYEKILSGNLANFAMSSKYAASLTGFIESLAAGKFNKHSFVKGQVTGPFTFGGSLTDKDNRVILHNSMLMDALVNGLGLKAAWQKEQFRKFGKKVIIAFDEPYLGCFGSAYTPLNQDEVVKRLSDLISPLKDENTLIGIHCCGNTDWAMLLDIGFDIMNFDAYGFSERFLLYPNEIKSFLKRDGIIAWGLVPTGDIPKNLDINILMEKFQSSLNILERKGIEKELVLNQSIITPGCGMGTMQVEDAVKVTKLLSELSIAFKEKYINTL